MAYISPSETGWVYEEPTQILATLPDNTTQVLKIYSTEFNWRGELFLTFGEW